MEFQVGLDCKRRIARCQEPPAREGCFPPRGSRVAHFDARPCSRGGGKVGGHEPIMGVWVTSTDDLPFVGAGSRHN